MKKKYRVERDSMNRGHYIVDDEGQCLLEMRLSDVKSSTICRRIVSFLNDVCFDELRAEARKHLDMGDSREKYYGSGINHALNVMEGIKE